jgi:hypothetical protein
LPCFLALLSAPVFLTLFFPTTILQLDPRRSGC